MTQRYSIASIALHWTMMLAIAAAWLIAQFIEDMPRGPDRVLAQGAHAAFGLAVAALLLPRLLARFLGGTLTDSVRPVWEQRLGQAAHLLLYALMIAMPLSGVAIALSGRAPFPVLGLFELPPLLSAYGLRKTLEEVHGVLSNVLLGAIALHVAATLWHVFVRHDGIAGRMIPVLRR